MYIFLFLCAHFLFFVLRKNPQKNKKIPAAFFTDAYTTQNKPEAFCAQPHGTRPQAPPKPTRAAADQRHQTRPRTHTGPPDTRRTKNPTHPHKCVRKYTHIYTAMHRPPGQSDTANRATQEPDRAQPQTRKARENNSPNPGRPPGHIVIRHSPAPHLKGRPPGHMGGCILMV